MSEESAPIITTRSGRLAVLGAVVMVLAVAGAAYALVLGVFGSGVAGGVPEGPTGDDFYRIEASQITADGPGTLVWQRQILSGPTLEGATTHRVVYRSQDESGRTVAVSGLISVPDGDPPSGGWPVLSWGHGTTGLADGCAPSRQTPGGPTAAYLSQAGAALSRWVTAGYVVARTDYLGLGLDGDHPYLDAASSARAMVDIVRAARELDGDVGPQWVVGGIDEGANAALWAADLSQRTVLGSDLVAALALAPVTDAAGVLSTSVTTDTGSVMPALLLAGVQAGAGVDATGSLSEVGLERYADLRSRCLSGLQAGDSLGGLDSTELFTDSPSLGPVVVALRDSDPARSRPRTPVLVVGAQDDPIRSAERLDALADTLTKAETEVTRSQVEGNGFVDTLAAMDDARAWVLSR